MHKIWIALLVMAPCLFVHGDEESTQAISSNPQDWPMYNHDSQGTRWNTGEKVLSTRTVARLREKWRYITAGDVYGTPAVVDNTIYFGDTSGRFYAMTHKGSVLWMSQVQAAITDSALVTNAMVIFGDHAGNIYGLERSTGKRVWQVHPNKSGALLFGVRPPGSRTTWDRAS